MGLYGNLALKVSRDFRNVADFSFFVLFIIWKFKALARVDNNFLSWMPFEQQSLMSQSSCPKKNVSRPKHSVQANEIKLYLQNRYLLINFP